MFYIQSVDKVGTELAFVHLEVLHDDVGRPVLNGSLGGRLDPNHGAHELVVAAFRVSRARAAGVRFEDGEQIGAVVARSAPSPVDPEVVVAGISVDDEGVSAHAPGLAAVEHGSTFGQFIVDDPVPFVHREVFVVDDARGMVETEILDQRVGHVEGVGTRRAAGVIHVDRHAAVLHEPGHGLRQRIGVCSLTISWQHVGPVYHAVLGYAVHMDQPVARPRRVRVIRRHGSLRLLDHHRVSFANDSRAIRPWPWPRSPSPSARHPSATSGNACCKACSGLTWRWSSILSSASKQCLRRAKRCLRPIGRRRCAAPLSGRHIPATMT